MPKIKIIEKNVEKICFFKKNKLYKIIKILIMKDEGDKGNNKFKLTNVLSNVKKILLKILGNWNQFYSRIYSKKKIVSIN